MSEAYLTLPFQYDGHQWTSTQGALYQLPPERSVKCFDRDLIGDCDLTHGLAIIRQHFPNVFVQFAGGMSFDGKPLWRCDLGMLILDSNGRRKDFPRPKIWAGEASDKASSLQRAMDEMVYWMQKRKYDWDNGFLLV